MRTKYDNSTWQLTNAEHLQMLQQHDAELMKNKRVIHAVGFKLHAKQRIAKRKDHLNKYEFNRLFQRWNQRTGTSLILGQKQWRRKFVVGLVHFRFRALLRIMREYITVYCVGSFTKLHFQKKKSNIFVAFDCTLSILKMFVYVHWFMVYLEKGLLRIFHNWYLNNLNIEERSTIILKLLLLLLCRIPRFLPWRKDLNKRWYFDMIHTTRQYFSHTHVKVFISSQSDMLVVIKTIFSFRFT